MSSACRALYIYEAQAVFLLEQTDRVTGATNNLTHASAGAAVSNNNGVNTRF